MSLGAVGAEYLNSEAVSAPKECVPRSRKLGAPTNAVPRNVRREQSVMDFSTVRDSIPEGATKPGGVALVCARARLVGKPEVIPPTVADLVLRRSASNGINTRMLHTRDLADEQWQTLDPLRMISQPAKSKNVPDQMKIRSDLRVLHGQMSHDSKDAFPFHKDGCGD